MSLKGLQFVILISALFVSPAVIRAAQTMIPLRLLYPSFAGSWGTAWITKEATATSLVARLSSPKQGGLGTGRRVP